MCPATAYDALRWATRFPDRLSTVRSPVVFAFARASKSASRLRGLRPKLSKVIRAPEHLAHYERVFPSATPK